MESFPIYRHHTHADVRDVWHCTRKATGTVVVENDRLPAMTTYQLGQLRCSTGGRAELLLPRAKSPWAHVATLGHDGHQTMTMP